MSHISTAEVARMAGYTKRQIQRMAGAGQIPGAVRTGGGHWHIPDAAAVRAWCKSAKRARALSTAPKRSRRGQENYAPHLARLLTVLRKTLPGMTSEQLAALVEDTEQLRDMLNALASKVRKRSDGTV